MATMAPVARPLAGKICLVTGGTRGIGRGIALQLGSAGATVYVTGRTLKKIGDTPGSLEETAREIEERGGHCIPIQCDHTQDEQVKAVFSQIQRDHDGQLDILVNNAYAAVNAISAATGKPFWECEDNMWDTVNNVGLRNHYYCTIHAARLMTPRKQGLIINISSAGGLRYLFNVPYGVGKAALDRMAADCAVELRKHRVAMVSLWPGAVSTELANDMLERGKRVIEKAAGEAQERRTISSAKQMQRLFANAETPEYSGKIITALAQDPKIMEKSGRILLSADLGREYGVVDIDGRQIETLRSVAYLLRSSGWKTTASFIPGCIRVPYFMLALVSSKF